MERAAAAVDAEEARKYVWQGSIPLQIHLHDSEVTTLPPPPPVLILASRIGFLPLLVPQIKPLFSSALPPGADTVWFDYKGLPLKWYIPTGVLFDLLCPEPERPWNLTVHFRGYPGNILVPYEGEDSVKWSFINSLKEAAYIINGNCKNVMNMSQTDQSELWHSVLNGNLDAYVRISSMLKFGTVGDEYSLNVIADSQQSISGTDITGPVKAGRIPVRLYVWSVSEDFNHLEDAPQIDSWEGVSYINQPVEFHREEGKCFTLRDALKTLLPDFFMGDEIKSRRAEVWDVQTVPLEDESSSTEKKVMDKNLYEQVGSGYSGEIKLIRIQGIEPKLEIPFSWVFKNLMNPEHYLHICVYVRVLQTTTTTIDS